MYGKIIINFILILCVVVLQLSFINGLPAGINNLNLILVILIFILVLVNFDFALLWAICLGFLLDIFLLAPFGLYLVCLSITVISANFLLTHFFTNRSLYSFFSLIILSSVIYEFFLNLFWILINSISGKSITVVINSGFWFNKLNQLFFNVISVFIIFNIISFVGNRLKPVFLVKNKKM